MHRPARCPAGMRLAAAVPARQQARQSCERGDAILRELAVTASAMRHR